MTAIFKRVVMESPYSGDIKRNIIYARSCLSDCLSRNEAPIASHLLYTQDGVLDDSDWEQRQTGIEAGLSWTERADYVVVYCDYGITEGMKQGIRAAEAAAKTIYYRTLGVNGLNIEVKPHLSGYRGETAKGI